MVHERVCTRRSEPQTKMVKPGVAPVVKPEGRRSHGDAAEKWPTAATRREQPLANVQGSRRGGWSHQVHKSLWFNGWAGQQQVDNQTPMIPTRQLLTRYAQNLHALLKHRASHDRHSLRAVTDSHMCMYTSQVTSGGAHLMWVPIGERKGKGALPTGAIRCEDHVLGCTG